MKNTSSTVSALWQLSTWCMQSDAISLFDLWTKTKNK